MSLPSAGLFPGFIVLTSPHERLADPTQRIFEVTLQAKNLELWCMVMSISDAIYDCYHQ